MHTDMDLDQQYNAGLTSGGSWTTGGPAASHGNVHRTGITPPRLRAIDLADPATTQPVPTVLVADLRLPVELVHERTEVYAARARVQGTPHSMRLWRQCFEQALTMLTRETGHIPADASCEALFWQQKDGEYWVSATFGRDRPLPVLH